ncbi:MAG: hypothetical protein ACLR8Y_08380 [Alistipes indistinctus]
MTAPQTNNADLTKGKLRHFLRLCYLVVAVTVAVQAYCIFTKKTVVNGWILLAAALSVAIVTLPLRNRLEMAGRSGQRHSPHSLSFVPRNDFLHGLCPRRQLLPALWPGSYPPGAGSGRARNTPKSGK